MARRRSSRRRARARARARLRIAAKRVSSQALETHSAPLSDIDPPRTRLGSMSELDLLREGEEAEDEFLDYDEVPRGAALGLSLIHI